jgi:hypothetical protein
MIAEETRRVYERDGRRAYSPHMTGRSDNEKIDISIACVFHGQGARQGDHSDEGKASEEAGVEARAGFLGKRLAVKVEPFFE